MTTNDPQAGYGAEQREPMPDHYVEKQLKYIEALVIACKAGGYDIGEDISLANEAVKTLQAMLTSGELMVRNKCAKCGNIWTPTFITKDRCPGCGSAVPA